MPQVVFYLLQQQISRQDAACSIAARYARGQDRLCLYAGSMQQAENLDNLLWVFADDAFVPHAMAEDANAKDVLVQIYCGQHDIGDSTVLNLADSIPQVAGLARVIELVPEVAAEKTAARERFRLYREQGIEPEHVPATSLDMVQ